VLSPRGGREVVGRTLLEQLRELGEWRVIAGAVLPGGKGPL
jgi:hypothetical protein